MKRRICVTHYDSRVPFVATCQTFIDSEAALACDVVLLVESRDGDGRLLGLLAADQCANCLPPQGDGKGTVCLGFHPPTVDENGDESGEGEYEWGPCPSCGGSGHTLRAPIREDGHLAMSAKWVAVLPVEQP